MLNGSSFVGYYILDMCKKTHEKAPNLKKFPLKALDPPYRVSFAVHLVLAGCGLLRTRWLAVANPLNGLAPHRSAGQPIKK